MANSYWEAKLKEENFEKFQNDDLKLFDFIKDKYERKRYAKKGKDPMTNIYEGKEPEESTVQSVQPEEEKSNNFKKDSKPRHIINKDKIVQSQVQAEVSNCNGNASLIEFSSSQEANPNLNQGNGNQLLQAPNLLNFNNNFEGKTQSKQSGFAFINNSNRAGAESINSNISNITCNTSNLTSTSSELPSSSLIDLNSYESQKTNQIKQLTESIANVYTKPELTTPKGLPNSFIQMNQPNINIMNTYYGYGMSNQNLMINQPINQHNSHMLNMNNYNYNPHSYYPNANVNNFNLLEPKIQIVNNTNLTLNEGNSNKINNSKLIDDKAKPFDFDYFNKSISTTPRDNGTSQFFQLDATGAGTVTHGNSGINYNMNMNANGNNSNNSQKKEDPFKNLVSFR